MINNGQVSYDKFLDDTEETGISFSFGNLITILIKLFYPLICHNQYEEGFDVIDFTLTGFYKGKRQRISKKYNFD